MKKVRPHVLIEEWLPIEEIGVECLRENSTGKHPALNRMHVWWARRPLTASRASVLASVLPAWHDGWPADLKKEFPTESAYRDWFLRTLGIFGDPVETRRRIAAARKQGVDLGANPYGYRRAFSHTPEKGELDLLRRLLRHAWGKSNLAILDPMAGGGSIPFESLRFGFEVHANDLNPVAVTVERATLDYPIRFGESLAGEVRRYGDTWCKAIKRRLEPFFPEEPRGSVHAYVWARTVLCPSTKKEVPLSPNWWLVQKGSSPTCVELRADPNEERCRFRVVTGALSCSEANPVERGTVRRGTGRSPWNGWEPIDEAYIKAEARAGRMGYRMYAVAIKSKNGGFEFRAPTEVDESASRAATDELRRLRADFERHGLWPDEPRSGGRSDFIESYGFSDFASLFMPRQLLALLVATEELNKVKSIIRSEVTDRERQDAVITYLALCLTKAVDYNSGQCVWDSTRNKSAHTFNLHDFRIRWNPSEFDAARSLFPWVLDQVLQAFKELCRLTDRVDSPARLTIADASRLAHLKTESIDHVNVDPPYYYNVMYSECADFFYVWHKRVLADVFPALYQSLLTDKESEAVANSSRFKDFGKRKDDLATADYERKISAFFAEMYRVLRPDGVMTVMFTNRQVRAWDALAYALIEAGFVVTTSWPVHTESESSLHIAKKNAAKSTILLACRKRESEAAGVWWDDAFQARVAEVVHSKASEYECQGIGGVDLCLSTFGPVLHLISTSWPVRDPQGGDPIRPERALDLARRAVSDYRFSKLCTSYRVDLEPVTRWTVIAWDIFRAAEFPFDEARKLALAIAGNVQVEVTTGATRKTTKRKDFLEGTIVVQSGVAEKSGESLKLLSPADRVKHGYVDLESETLNERPIDAIHAAIAIHDQDGLGAVGKFLDKSGLARDKAFLGAFEALLHAIPLVRAEWKALEAIRQAHLTKKVKAPPPPENLELFPVGASVGGGDDTDDDAAEDEDEGDTDE